MKTRLLTLNDAIAVQSVFDSQPLIMLSPKLPDAIPYAQAFSQNLNTGCICFGAFDNKDTLVAFVTFWPWPDAPLSTLVMICNRPTGSVFSGRLSGLGPAFDAAVTYMESLGYTGFYSVRANNPRWKNHIVQARLGRFNLYQVSVPEIIPQHCLSRYTLINQRVLGQQPVRTEVLLMLAVLPFDVSLNQAVERNKLTSFN
jgi:hypothetical protein